MVRYNSPMFSAPTREGLRAQASFGLRRILSAALAFAGMATIAMDAEANGASPIRGLAADGDCILGFGSFLLVAELLPS